MQNEIHPAEEVRSREERHDRAERSTKKSKRLESGIVAKRLQIEESFTSIPLVQSSSQLPSITHSDNVQNAL